MFTRLLMVAPSVSIILHTFCVYRALEREHSGKSNNLTVDDFVDAKAPHLQQPSTSTDSNWQQVQSEIT